MLELNNKYLHGIFDFDEYTRDHEYKNINKL